jgi:hypothetical protein
VKRFCVLLFLFASAICWTQSSQQAAVTGGGLRVRSRPNLQGQILFQMQRGDVVDVLERSDTPMQIGELQSHWYRVRHRLGTGWTYGAYLTFDSVRNDEFDLAVFRHDDKNDPLLQHFYIVCGKENCRHEEIYEASVQFAPSVLYYAVVGLQDIVGGIAIHETKTGDLLHHARIVGPHPIWDGDRLTFRAVVREDGGLISWQEMRFQLGRVVPTGRTGQIRDV